jgi:hypothetical protein
MRECGRFSFLACQVTLEFHPGKLEAIGSAEIGQNSVFQQVLEGETRNASVLNALEYVPGELAIWSVRLGHFFLTFGSFWFRTVRFDTLGSI